MFYYVSKVLWFLLQPSSLITVGILFGLLLCFSSRFLIFGRRLVLLGCLGLIVGGLSPLANVLMVPLEGLVAAPDLSKSGKITGIIILGGAENGRISVARNTMALNEAGERLSEALRLGYRYPDAKILFSGGAGKMFREEKSGAPSITTFLTSVGIAKSRLIVEDRSRNTYENALFSKKTAQPKPGDRWLLVTSAYHMSRALGCFRKVGFEVIPWPVDYRTKDVGDFLRPFDSVAKGLKRLDLAFKEWIGLVAYRLTGRTLVLLTH